MPERSDVLEQGRREAGLSHGDLWFRYFALGGMRTALEVEAYLYGALMATAHDRDLIAVALNERFSELGGDHPVPYSDDEYSAD
jgi:predicted DNA-binding ribbon-helix-helix protein